MVIVLSVPLGGSLTGVTLTVMVLGDGSKARPLVSRTLKVKVVYGEPLALAAGVKTRLGMLAARIAWPGVTATLERVRLLAAGKLSMRTALSASTVSTSLKPKSAPSN